MDDPTPAEVSADCNVLLCSNDFFGAEIRASLAEFCPHCHVHLLSDSGKITSTLLSESFDILLLDMDVENCAADDILREVRQHFLPDQLPILLIVGDTFDSQCNAAFDLGVTDFLHKPLQAVETRLRVRNALKVRGYFFQKQSAQERQEQEVSSRTAKLNMLIDSGVMMAMEKSRERLIRHILQEGQKILHCDGATMYLVTRDNTLSFAIRTRDDSLPFKEIHLFDPVSGKLNESYVSAYAANHKETIVIDNIYEETRFDFSGTRAFDAQSGYRTVSLLAVPMAPRNGSVIGVLQFFNALDSKTKQVTSFPADALPLVEALAAQAAVAMDNLQLLATQKAITESVIQVLASAMDTKSPHTGHHCVKVPELAIMLAEAACKQQTGPLADFNFGTEDEWFEFRVGAWLHDCGKVTTPECVIDKATKLDMIYNRIHEIRMRFEVLLRDAEIQRLEAIQAGEDAEQASQTFEQARAGLQDDFAFIAKCNLGREGMEDDDCQRIKRIAEKTWLRHFDDCLGLSPQETKRVQNEVRPSLPVVESLLSDKAIHIIPRPDQESLHKALGIKMAVPENMYNYGEIYNLSISRGTLTAEERYKINEHIIETIKLLEKIPFPDFLKRVPEYASTHHETMDGRGYPRRLTGAELSIPARIMAVADIFEAITASDRPYKKPYMLSKSLRILQDMKNNQHIDADIYDLFLRSGVYLEYANKYLNPDQIDVVDITEFLEPALES